MVMRLVTPVVIPTFNNPTYLKNMLDQLNSLGIAKITVIDNHSTTLEMLSLLDALAKNIEVVSLPYNHGPQYFHENESFYDNLPDHFCITDPDIAFNERMPKTFLDELREVSEQFKVGKTGLALDISNVGDMRTDQVRHGGKEYNIWDWEAQFWLDKIGETPQHDPIYNAEVDTTFALCNKRYFDRTKPNNAVRIAGRYTCRHMPWYRKNTLPQQEEQQYRATQQHSWYFGGPQILPENPTLGERLKRNRLLIKHYGVPLWFGEKLARWAGMSRSWEKIKSKMKMIDRE